MSAPMPRGNKIGLGVCLGFLGILALVRISFGGDPGTSAKAAPDPAREVPLAALAHPTVKAVPSEWHPTREAAQRTVAAFREMEHGSYTATLMHSVTLWKTVEDIEDAQKFVGAHPNGRVFPIGLQGAIACHLPDGAHVVVNPWDTSRFEEVMTPDGPHGYCDGVAFRADGE